MHERLLLTALKAWRDSLNLSGFAFTHRLLAGSSAVNGTYVCSLAVAVEKSSRHAVWVPFTTTETVLLPTVLQDGNLGTITTAEATLRAALDGKRYDATDLSARIRDHVFVSAVQQLAEGSEQLVITWSGRATLRAV